MTANPQIPLDLSRAPEHSFANLLISDCNATAVKTARAWRDWPSPILLLIGPHSSGKTHIGQAWAAETGGTFIDNADTVLEAELFASMNKALNGELKALLLAACKAPQNWGILMPDLFSRLKNTPTALLEEHDDMILEPILQKLFKDRGRSVSSDLVQYLLKYHDRSVSALREIVKELDIAAQSKKADLTKAFATKHLKSRST